MRLEPVKSPQRGDALMLASLPARCRRLARAMGGDLKHRSAAGASFELSLVTSA